MLRVFAGKTIDIAGTVNGDVFCAGQTVTISGQVNGDVICAGQTVTLSGKVTGSVRLAGQTVSLTGTISANASIAGQSVTTDSNSTVGGDLSVGGQEAVVNGAVGRDLFIGGSVATIGNKVGRNVAAADDTLRLSSGAVIGGNVHYVSKNQLSQASTAQVAGQVSRSEPAKQQQRSPHWSIWAILTMLFVLMLTALVLVLLVPRAFQTVASTALTTGLLKTFALGLVASIVVPVIAVGVMFTVVGIPLGLLVLLLWFSVVAVSSPFAAYLAGRLLWRKGTNSISIMLLGSVVLLLLLLIPGVNFIVVLLALWFGVGSVLLQVGRLGRPHYGTAALAKKSH
jgi:cytoskeletal protein CcmA (bactofilin family)